jgi:hypothetical protein
MSNLEKLLTAYLTLLVILSFGLVEIFQQPIEKFFEYQIPNAGTQVMMQFKNFDFVFDRISTSQIYYYMGGHTPYFFVETKCLDWYWLTDNICKSYYHQF